MSSTELYVNLKLHHPPITFLTETQKRSTGKSRGKSLEQEKGWTEESKHPEQKRQDERQKNQTEDTGI